MKKILIKIFDFSIGIPAAILYHVSAAIAMSAIKIYFLFKKPTPNKHETSTIHNDDTLYECDL